MYKNNSLFHLEDFRPGQRIMLTFNKHEYLLLDNDVLVNMKTGAINHKIHVLYDFVKSVADSKGKKLALRLENKLYKYDPFIHDEDLANIKRANGLLTGDELMKRLQEDRLFLNIHNLVYRQASTVRLSVLGMPKTFKRLQAQTILQRRLYKTQQDGTFTKYVDSYMTKINCIITMIEIDKKQELYLYDYQLTPY